MVKKIKIKIKIIIIIIIIIKIQHHHQILPFFLLGSWFYVALKF